MSIDVRWRSGKHVSCCCQTPSYEPGIGQCWGHADYDVETLPDDVNPLFAQIEIEPQVSKLLFEIRDQRRQPGLPSSQSIDQVRFFAADRSGDSIYIEQSSRIFVAIRVVAPQSLVEEYWAPIMAIAVLQVPPAETAPEIKQSWCSQSLGTLETGPYSHRIRRA